MKSYRVMGYCDSGRTKLDGWTPPQKIVTGASEKYAINLIKEWIKNHPNRFDEYVILEENTLPHYTRIVLREVYIIRRIHGVKNAKTWEMVEIKERFEEEQQ